MTKTSLDKVTFETIEGGYKVYNDGKHIGTVRKEETTRRRRARHDRWSKSPLVTVTRWVGTDLDGNDTPGELRTRKLAVKILLERMQAHG